jgi:hypothetical protein
MEDKPRMTLSKQRAEIYANVTSHIEQGVALMKYLHQHTISRTPDGFFVADDGVVDMVIAVTDSNMALLTKLAEMQRKG